VESVRPVRVETRPDLKDITFSEGGPKAWFAVARRAPASPAISTVVETVAYGDDLAAMEAFYTEKLGLVVIGREADRHVFFRAGPASVFLVFKAATTLRGDTLPPHGATGASHFAFGIAPDAYDAWRRRLTENGVAIEREVTWPLGGKSIYFRDPAGNLGELITPGVWGTPAGW
jgi:catechol 2,3-dioxygenase-like lactoylglutathione lyase family enzyme